MNRRRPGMPAKGSRPALDRPRGPHAVRRRPRRTASVGRARRVAQPRGAVVAQDLQRRVFIAPADDIDRLVLERLVRVEEVLDLDEAMGADLLEPLDVLLVGVADRDAQDLEVEALLVAHLEAADRARPDMAAGEGGLVDDQQGVGVVAVTGAGALDEPVIEVVEDGAAQHPVQAVDADLFVELVLVARPARDLDDDLDHVRKLAGTLHAATIPRGPAHDAPWRQERSNRRRNVTSAAIGSLHVPDRHSNRP